MEEHIYERGVKKQEKKKKQTLRELPTPCLCVDSGTSWKASWHSFDCGSWLLDVFVKDHGQTTSCQYNCFRHRVFNAQCPTKVDFTFINLATFITSKWWGLLYKFELSTNDIRFTYDCLQYPSKFQWCHSTSIYLQTQLIHHSSIANDKDRKEAWKRESCGEEEESNNGGKTHHKHYCKQHASWRKRRWAVRLQVESPLSGCFVRQ